MCKIRSNEYRMLVRSVRAIILIQVCAVFLLVAIQACKAPKEHKGQMTSLIEANHSMLLIETSLMSQMLDDKSPTGPNGIRLVSLAKIKEIFNANLVSEAYYLPEAEEDGYINLLFNRTALLARLEDGSYWRIADFGNKRRCEATPDLSDYVKLPK